MTGRSALSLVLLPAVLCDEELYGPHIEGLRDLVEPMPLVITEASMAESAAADARATRGGHRCGPRLAAWLLNRSTLRDAVKRAAETPILILPGLGDSGPEHWQSRWERSSPACRRVVQRDWDRPELPEWLAALDRYVGECAAPPVLVAHSLACALVAHWAARGGAGARGALLVAPSDVESPAHTPPEVRNFSPIPLLRFPFPTIVVASTNDPYVAFDRAALLANTWGSRLVTLRDAGHVNASSGLGDWPEGKLLLADLLRAA